MFADNITTAHVRQPSTVTSNHNKKQSWWWMTCPCQFFFNFFLSLSRSMQWKSKCKLRNRVTSFHQKWCKFIKAGDCTTFHTWWLGCAHQFVANTNGKVSCLHDSACRNTKDKQNCVAFPSHQVLSLLTLIAVLSCHSYLQCHVTVIRHCQTTATALMDLPLWLTLAP